MNKNLKLYYAVERAPDVIYASTYESKDQARLFLKEEKDIHIFPMEVKEITCISQVPAHWQDGFIWGLEEDITPLQFLKRQQDPDYQLYLQLKKRFEK